MKATPLAAGCTLTLAVAFNFPGPCKGHIGEPPPGSGAGSTGGDSGPTGGTGSGAGSTSSGSGPTGGTGGSGCIPTTCAAKNAVCGTIPNDCGGTLDCGSCSAPVGRYVGMYIEAPGYINNHMPKQCSPTPMPPDNFGCGKGCVWPEHRLPAPLGSICEGSPGEYTTDCKDYWGFLLDSAAAMGVDFVIADESNGGQFHDYLVQFLDYADSRFDAEIKTPRVTAMARAFLDPNDQNSDKEHVWNDEAKWMELHAARDKNGLPRKSWVYFKDKPLLLAYSVPFSTTHKSDVFEIRYVCDSANNECHQPEKENGMVWPWQTMGNSCDGFSDSSPHDSCPLFSPSSEEITIQNGYQNWVACVDYWCNCGDPNDPKNTNWTAVGFTPAYYAAQWAWAIPRLQSASQFMVIATYDAVAEGGFIQRSTAFAQPTIYEEATTANTQAWKGTGNLRFLGPPGSSCPASWCQVAPSAPSPKPLGCTFMFPGQSIGPNESVVSCDGRFTLILQPDNNLVLYFGSSPLWYLGLGSGADRLIMQPDGNLVLYAGQNPVWNSGTSGHPGAFLAVQPDGNMVVYIGTTYLWQSNTCCH